MIVTDCRNIAISVLGSDIDKIIADQAHLKGLDPLLVKAIVDVESGGNPFATRVEANWKYRFKADHFAKQNRTTVDTENVMQSMSWGLMQIMGTVARELGFTMPMPMLCVPEIGLDYGMAKLKMLMNKYKYADHAVAAYNAGSLVYSKQGNLVNHGYVAKVLAKYGELKSLIAMNQPGT